MKKKILSMCLVVALLAIAIVGGTLAYFTDTDSDKNVFTTGNISIDQFEMMRDEDGKLVAFEDDNLLMPAVGDPKFDGEQVSYTEAGAPGWNEMWAKHMNAEDKFVFVKNDGSEAAYYRTIIAIEDPGVTYRLNLNGNALFDWDPNTTGAQNGDSKDSWYVTVDGVQYLCLVATYTAELAKDEVSRPSLLQIAVDKETTQEQMEKFGTDGVQVYAFTEAVQAEGFADLYTEDVACNALKDAFGAIDATYLATALEAVINPD